MAIGIELVDGWWVERALAPCRRTDGIDGADIADAGDKRRSKLRSCLPPAEIRIGRNEGEGCGNMKSGLEKRLVQQLAGKASQSKSSSSKGS